MFIPETRIRVETLLSGEVRYYPEVLEKDRVEHNLWQYVIDKDYLFYVCESRPYMEDIQKAKDCIDYFLKDLTKERNIIKYP